MDSNKVSKQNDEPFPARQLLTLGLCRLAEPIAFISIVSYNFAMVKEIKGPENASFWAGVLVSAFAIAEASTAMIWGSLSDRIGRKPVILIGLAGTTISSIILGFATNYWVALAARLVGGLLNGNVAVMQTMVAEMVKNPKHEPRAYSIQPFAWSLGSIAGSALGGYAAQPARFYPQYFSADGIFGRYPYLLPNAIAAGCICLAIVQAALFLEETNPAVQPYEAIGDNSSAVDDSIEPDEETPLIKPVRRPSFTEAMADRSRRLSYVAGSTPIPEEPSIDLRRPSMASVRSLKFEQVRITTMKSPIEEDREDVSSTTSSVMAGRTFSKPVIMWVAAIALMCYHQMAFVSVFPIFVLDEPRVEHGLDLKGGLGLTVHDTGRYMAVNSFLSLFIQAFILPLFLSKVGIRKSIITLTLFAPCVDICMSLVTVFPNPKIAVYPIFILTAFCNIIIYPAMLIMLKNAAPSKQALGKVNGLAVSASSAMRTIAPPLIGLFYTALGSAGAWWSCALFGLLAAVELCFIPKQKKLDLDILRKASLVVPENEEAA